jgi:hypothetical protein
MGNMSYCRFENTAGDLQDCLDNFEVSESELSDSEKRARCRIIRMACDIAESYADEIGIEAEIVKVA